MEVEVVPWTGEICERKLQVQGVAGAAGEWGRGTVGKTHARSSWKFYLHAAKRSELISWQIYLKMCHKNAYKKCRATLWWMGRGDDRRGKGAGGCWTNKLYTIFLARLIFDLFLNFYEFVLCSWLWANKMLTWWGKGSARGVVQGAGCVLCHPRDSLRGRLYTLNHKYFPCQQLISLWFICKCEFAFYVFIFIYFIFAPRIQWVSLNSSSTLALPSPLYVLLWLPSPSARRCERVFFYSSTPSSIRTHSRVILLPFLCSTFTWLPFSASRFSLSAFCFFR